MAGGEDAGLEGQIGGEQRSGENAGHSGLRTGWFGVLREGKDQRRFGAEYCIHALALGVVADTGHRAVAPATWIWMTVVRVEMLIDTTASTASTTYCL